MSRCKALEILRSEAYSDVRRNDEGREQRRRWIFFTDLLGRKSPTDVLRQESEGEVTQGEARA